jgi:phage-related protein
MDIRAKKLSVVFYRTDTGVEPVRNWLRELPRVDKKTIGEDIKTVQFGWPLGMPLVDSLGHGLWEVRTKLPGGRIARVLFFMDSNTMVLVNGFIKKTQSTPKPELELARKRKKQYELSVEK